MDGKAAYFKNAGYKVQLKAMETNMAALESNLLNFTLWNYSPDNNHAMGDNWNGEDLSIWSPDDLRKRFSSDHCMTSYHESTQKAILMHGSKRDRSQQMTSSTLVSNIRKSSDDDVARPLSRGTVESDTHTLSPNTHSRSQTSPETLLHSSFNSNRAAIEQLSDGARALAAFLRPYPVATAGTPIRLSFNSASRSKEFKYVFRGNRSLVGFNAPTEIFLPLLHFGLPAKNAVVDSSTMRSTLCRETNKALFFEVRTSGGSWDYDDETQILTFYHGNLSS